MHQKRPGGIQVRLIEQNLDHTAKGARRIEFFHVGSPERDAFGTRAGLAPGRQCSRYATGGNKRLLAGNMADTAEGSCGKSIPPLGELTKWRCKARLQLAIVRRRRVVPQSGVEAKDLLH